MGLCVNVIFASRVMLMDVTIFLEVVFIFLVKHRTSKMYIEVTVRTLFSLNFCLHDSSFSDQ